MNITWRIMQISTEPKFSWVRFFSLGVRTSRSKCLQTRETEPARPHPVSISAIPVSQNRFPTDTMKATFIWKRVFQINVDLPAIV